MHNYRRHNDTERERRRKEIVMPTNLSKPFKTLKPFQPKAQFINFSHAEHHFSLYKLTISPFGIYVTFVLPATRLLVAIYLSVIHLSI